MGTYYIPRNVKGEGRILFIFSGKSMIYTAVGAGIGFFLYLIFSAVGLTWVGIGAIALLGLIGFSIGTFKIPSLGGLEFSKKTSGENIDDIILRAIKFKMNKKKIYIYKEEGEE
jgi:hypothetical protein